MKKIIAIIVFCILFAGVAFSANNDNVVFNTKSLKVHKIYCKYASACTVNCIKTTRTNAYKQGGKPCKVCGG